MSNIKNIVQFLIYRIDRYYGYIRYHNGNKKIGSLKMYEKTDNIYYLMIPSFGNIGDEAIVESSLCFLQDQFPEYRIITIDYLETLQSLKEIKRIIKKNDIIVLQGGGNIGTLYYDVEIIREFVIRKFKDYTIVSMPQSVYYSSTKKGKRRLEKSKKIYNNHNKLVLIAREQYSYKKMKDYYSSCKILLNPDIVFYYSLMMNYDNKSIRQGIMICLRNDHEDTLGEKKYELINTLFAEFEDIVVSDTCVPRNITDVTRKNEVLSLINQINRMKIVITDRLHGMVISALTNTPCIVLPSIDDKVIGTYKWIEDNEIIYFIDKYEINEIKNIIQRITNKKGYKYDWKQFRGDYFDDLRKRIGV